MAQRTPEEIFAHHAEALGAEDLDRIMSAYRDDASSSPDAPGHPRAPTPSPAGGAQLRK